MSTHRQDRKQRMTRMAAMIIAGVMIFSVLAAAILSQVW